MHSRIMMAAVACCVAAVSVGAQIKIGYVNYDSIAERFSGTKVAADKFKNEQAKMQQDIEKRQNVVKALQDQIEKQSMLLSQERKKQLVDSLQQQYLQYQQYAQQKQSELESKYVECMSPVQDTILKVIIRKAMEENFDIVFEKRGTIIYAQPKYNITDRILGLLPQQPEGKKTVLPGAANKKK